MSIFKCTRCNEETETPLITEAISNLAVCYKCRAKGEWICEGCHRAVVEEDDYGVSVAAAFMVCTQCIKIWNDQHLKEMFQYGKNER